MVGSFLMKAPIVIDEHGDVSVFETVENAQRALEVTDVSNNEYIAYDSEGRLLLLKVVAGDPRVSILEAESVARHADDLRRILKDFLVRTGSYDPSLNETSLQQLLAKFVSTHGYTS